MSSPGLVRSWYSDCQLKHCSAHSFKLGFDVPKTVHVNDLIEAIEACAAAHKTFQGAGVKASCLNSWTNGKLSGFEMMFEAAPLSSPLGNIRRPFSPSEMNVFATALHAAGCISHEAKFQISRAVSALQHGRSP